MKENILFIVLCLASLGLGWWARGCTIEGELRSRIEKAPQKVEHHEIEKPVVLPQLPAKMKPAKSQTKIATDSAAVRIAIDSIRAIYGDSLGMVRELLMPRKYEYEDTAKGFYMSLQAMTPFPPIIDSLKIRSVKCDSTVVTKYVPVAPDVPWYDHWYVPIAGEMIFVAAYIFAAPK